MQKKDKVVVLYGGKSGEHEISLRSAASVVSHLNPNLFDIIPVAIDKKGQLFINNYHEMLAFKDALPVKTASSKPLTSLDKNGEFAIDADVIFPVMHGPLYEDGCLQGILESLSVAYVGCGVVSSAIGMDKDISRKLGCEDDILYTPYITLTAFQSESQRQQAVDQLITRDKWPLFVKPCAMGSSVGIHKVYDKLSLQSAVKDAFRFDHTVIIEDAIQGQEVEVAVLEEIDLGAPARTSTPGEIITAHTDGFYSYNAKYCQSEQTNLAIPATISDELIQEVKQAALTIFNRLKCHGLARLDFFVAESKIYFNEINTLPGFTSISMYPKMWQYDNLAYGDLLSHLVALAKKRHAIETNRITDYQ